MQCIRPRPGDSDYASAEQLYIDPATCIDCGACVPECPVDAISADYDLAPSESDYFEINAAYFVGNPVEVEDPPAIARRQLPENQNGLRVAVIGTGPAGCYAAAELSAIRGVEVTMIDRLPTPYGLVRSGVAPDHPKTKLAGEQFRSLLSRRNVHCLLNVEVGRDIGVDELLRSHHAVIHSYGAADDRRLGIDGEDLAGSMAARSFVAWYNGHPDHADDPVDLSTVERALIIGNGNVGLDVARFLARPASSFAKTDLAEHALQQLQHSRIREVIIAARRGPEDAAFTSTEILAMSRLDGVDLLTPNMPPVLATASPVIRRKLDVVAEAGQRQPNPQNRGITLRFGLTPVSIDGDDHVESVTFRVSDGTYETIEASLVIRAIGYRGTPLEGVPFDAVAGIIPNRAGRIVDPATNEPVPGQYCAGWIKRGPSGFIGTNRTCSAETVESLLADLERELRPDPTDSLEDLRDLLAARNTEAIDYAAWNAINKAELAAGNGVGRSRVKLVSVEQLLAASRT